jgi:[ribosomal protein S5]-alanine N-acetyltransferase
MLDNCTTERLLLNDLSLNDAPFIYELVNTPNWIRFIGERNVKNHEDARQYIQKILNNPTANYTVVRLKDAGTPIGAITLLQRDYLGYPDIGFAFLPDYGKKGYAYEASNAVLKAIKEDIKPEYVLATTLKDNVNSIQLLEKLGLSFDKEILVDTTQLMVYSVSRLVS